MQATFYFQHTAKQKNAKFIAKKMAFNEKNRKFAF